MSAEYRQLIPAAAVVRAQRAGAARGVKMAGEMLRRDANSTCPIDTGALRNSARVSMSGEGSSATARVGYGAPYAIYAHEKPGQRYQGPGRYKWLALTGQEQSGKYARVIADSIRQAMP